MSPCWWINVRYTTHCTILQRHWHYPHWRADDRLVRMMVEVWWPQRRPRRPLPEQ